MSIRDRESLLRGYRRELEKVKDDPERVAAVKAEIARVESLPPAPTFVNQEVTAVEQESARVLRYLEGLKKELARASADRVQEIEAEIRRVESLLRLGPSTVENVRRVPKVERARLVRPAATVPATAAKDDDAGSKDSTPDEA